MRSKNWASPTAKNAQGPKPLSGRPGSHPGPVTAIQRGLSHLAAGRHAAVAWCALLLALMGVNLLVVSAGKSITTDEIVHIPAGYAHLAARDFRLNHEHPPLAKLWSAVPLLALGPELPPRAGPAKTPLRREFDYSREFWQRNNARLETILFWARLPMVLLTLALGALTFGYARRLFGPRAAVLAVAVFGVEPTLLAHGRIVHTDVPAALAYLAGLAALHAYATTPTPRRALLLGLVAGLAAATKFTMLIYLPVGAVAVLALAWFAPRRGLERRAIAAQGLAAGLAALLAINAIYLFRRPPLDPTDVAWVREQSPAHAQRLLSGVSALSSILPTDFVYGAYTQWVHQRQGHLATLFGEHSERGWWYYFPVAFALKTTLPFLLLALGATGWAIWRLAARGDRRVLAPLVGLLAYACLALTGRINIGVRHLLPIFPLLAILGGAALDRLLQWPGRPAVRARVAGALAALILGWMAVEAARAHPDYLPYMNQLARRPGWHYLSDSNVEWGDDVRALARYLAARDESAVRAALHAGWVTLRHYGIEHHDLLAPGTPPLPETRYVAIGAGFFSASTAGIGDGPAAELRRRNLFAAYREREAEAVFGRSIYLYRARSPVAPAGGPLPDGAYRARLAASRLPATLRAGEHATVRVRVANLGDVPWPRRGRADGLYEVRLGGHWLDAAGTTVIADDARTLLPDDFLPGDEVDLLLVITAPERPGEYVLEIDLVQEGVTWFGPQGSQVVRAPLRIVR